MKKFLKFYSGFESLTVLYFGAEVLMYMLLAPIWGIKSISFVLVWQMLLFSIIITIFQYVFYIWDLPKNLSRLKKTVIYYIILIIVGGIFTKIFNWFDLSSMKNIIIALVIFTCSFVSTYLGFDLYYKLTGEEYNQKLKIYKESKRRDLE